MNSFGALTDIEDNEIWNNAVKTSIMNTAPSEKRFDENIVHRANKQDIDERRKEKRNVVPGEKTWAEAAKTGSTETTRDKSSTTRGVSLAKMAYEIFGIFKNP